MCPWPGIELQPRSVPWPGIKNTPWCTGWCSNQPSHLARAAHLLLRHISLEMTHTVSIHFLLLSTSHAVPHLLQDKLGNTVLDWASTSQDHLHTRKGVINWCADNISDHKGYSKSICITSAGKPPGNAGSQDGLRWLKFQHLFQFPPFFYH